MPTLSQLFSLDPAYWWWEGQLTYSSCSVLNKNQLKMRGGGKNKVQCRPWNRTTETSSLISSRHFPLLSFWCYHKRNSLHTALSSYFISPWPTRHPFLCSQGRLLNLHKRPLASVNLCNQMNSNLHPLFCLHIQHTTFLFEQWRLIGSSEMAGCSFCLSIPLHTVSQCFAPLPLKPQG